MKLLILKDLSYAARSGNGFVLALLFYAAFGLLAPISVGPDSAIHLRMASGVIWIGALLSCLLALEFLLAEDYADGTLERLLLTPIPIETIVFSKLVVHWLLVGLPLCAAAPIVGMFFSLPIESGLGAALTLLIGAPAISAIGIFGAVLTLGLRRSSFLRTVIVVPSCVPVLVFGSAAANRIYSDLDAEFPLVMLAAISLVTTATLPYASAFVLKLTLRH